MLQAIKINHVFTGACNKSVNMCESSCIIAKNIDNLSVQDSYIAILALYVNIVSI